ncbi:MAG: methionine biosynthesis protein MetW [Chloroflexi bacterium]|nr:methionine biosynthesis protein MetW [Chloroflexota bacterium]
MTNLQSPISNLSPLRPDLRVIADLIPAGCRALDLGCGDGELLDFLIHQRRVRGRGIELSEQGVLACVRRGLTVRQGNLEEGLADYPDDSFDYVILSQTLPYLDNPAMILREMLRVGEKAIVSFPNWGYWRCRLELLLTGRSRHAPDLPQSWYDPPRWQAMTVSDFIALSRELNVRLLDEVYMAAGKRGPRTWFKNLLATTAVYVLAGND